MTTPPPKKQPWPYRRYLLIRGPKTGLPRLIQKTYITTQKLKHPDLKTYMETTPTTQTPLLFYPGCYIYSPTTIHATLTVLNHIGTPYTTLGGLTYCCGLPHRFQGNHTDAKACTQRLTNAITTINPHTIITSCLECLEALNDIKLSTNATYNAIHTLQYIHHHRDKFPKAKTKTPLIIHEPCRLADYPDLKTTIEDLITSLGTTPRYLPPTTPHCCRHWHHGDPTNKKHHTKIITATTTTVTESHTDASAEARKKKIDRITELYYITGRVRDPKKPTLESMPVEELDKLIRAIMELPVVRAYPTKEAAKEEDII